MTTLAARIVLPAILTVALAAIASMIIMISNDDEKKRQNRLTTQEFK